MRRGKLERAAAGERRAGPLLGHWRCALAHGGGTGLFSCGKGGERGNLRRWPGALAVVSAG